MDWFGVVTGLWGIAPSLYIAADKLRVMAPHRRTLGFSGRRDVEILVTASHRDISPVGPAHRAEERAIRTLLPAGDLAGVAELSVMLSRCYPRTSWQVTPSAEQQRDGQCDQILVGGPIHNAYTSRLICGNADLATEQTRIVFDATHRYIRFGDEEWGPGLDLRFEDHVPGVEYAVVLLTTVSRYGRDQRVVAVGGMTTYGTHAGCHFLANGMPGEARRHRLGRRPNAAFLVRSAIVNRQPYDVRALRCLRLDVGGAWQ